MLIGKVDRNILLQENKREEDRIAKLKEDLIDKTHKTKFKYYCSLCLIIKDENEYLEEWIRWHINEGIEHFYIYDNNSNESVKDFLLTLDLSIQLKVTLIDWCGSHFDAQVDAYNDCLNRFRYESRWIGFIDTDEQIRLKVNKHLKEFLKDYEGYAGLFMAWLCYGANGQAKKFKGDLRDRFKIPCSDEEWPKSMGKVIVQPIYMEEMVIHNGKAINGFKLVDEHYKSIANYQTNVFKTTRDLILVDHYYTKSYEEWINKLKRGSAHLRYSRKYDDFFKINPKMISLKEDLQIDQEYEKDNKKGERK